MADTSSSSINTARAIFVTSLLPDDRHAPHFSQQSAICLARQINITLNICSTHNMQRCKSGIMRYILPSTTRTAALFKYLLTLSKSCQPRAADFRFSETALGSNDELEGLKLVDGQLIPPKSAAKRLHVLYVTHDILGSILELQASQQLPSTFRHLDLTAILDKTKTLVLRLVRLAACRGEFSGDDVSQQLQRLIAKWRAAQVFSGEELQTLTALVASIQERSWEQVLEECTREDEEKLTEERRAREEARKWVLPLRHGVKDDPDAPWFELPAANGLYMKNVRGYPLRAGAFPKGGYELKYGGQEADSSLQKDVSWLHAEMLHCFDNYTDADEIQDVDPLGNKVWKDPERPTRNYWGFTYDGIEKARENARKFRDHAVGYDGVAPLMSDFGSMGGANVSDVARARALAVGRGGFDSRGGRGRGGRGSWRGPPRGGNGFRGGRGGDPPGRYY